MIIDTPFRGHPTALEVVRAPEVSIRVRERFPVDFGVVTDAQGVDFLKRSMDDEQIVTAREGETFVYQDVCVLGGPP